MGWAKVEALPFQHVEDSLAVCARLAPVFSVFVCEEDNEVAIVNKETHTLLEYVGLLQRNGYKPTVAEVEAFGKHPKRKEPLRGDPLLRYGLDPFEIELSPGEDYIEHLLRLSWVRVSSGRVELTDLGSALLRGLNAPPISSEDGAYVEVVVDPMDKFAFSRVLHHFSNLGPAMLVDPYLRLEQFFEIAGSTPVNRILTSSKALGKEGDRRRYQRAIGTTEGAVEVRYIDSLHDRYYIPETGDIWTLGVSLNGIKSNLSVLTKLGEESSLIIGKAYEDFWINATVLEPTEAAADQPSTVS